MRSLWYGILGLCVSGAFVSSAVAEEELQMLMERLLAPPAIQTEAGFSARVLVPPGQLYDPLSLLPQDSAVWLNDDGGEERDKGSRLLSIDAEGSVSILAGVGKLLPVTGFDVAPAGFGEFGGQIFTVGQATVGAAGGIANHIIQRVDPSHDYLASIFCTLPNAGDVNQGISGAGVQASFGLEGSPFAGKLFAITAYNNTIYQVTADGQCTPFITFDAERFGSPFGLIFSPDGKTMLVTVVRGGVFGPSQGSAIVRVLPDGTVEDTPVVQSQAVLGGIGLAPAGFGAYAGQMFVTATGDFQIPVPMTQALTADGKLYRVTPEGELSLVAAGFVNPFGLRFIGQTLWVSDINGDFIAGKRELPDGFIVEIRAE